MYCPNCGESIPDGSATCPVCGYAVKSGSSGAKKKAGSKSKPKRNKGKLPVKLVAVIAAAAAVIALFSTGILSFGSSPRKAARGYLNAIQTGNIKKLYQYSETLQNQYSSYGDMKSSIIGTEESPLLDLMNLSDKQKKKLGNSIEKLYTAFLKTMLHDYAVGDEEKIDDNTSRVTITVEVIDIADMQLDEDNEKTQNLESSLTAAVLGGNMDHAVDAAIDYLDSLAEALSDYSRTAQTQSDTDQITVIQKNGKWVVSDSDFMGTVENFLDTDLMY